MDVLNIKETQAFFLKAFPKSELQILEIRPTYIKVKRPPGTEMDLRPGNSVSGPTLMGFADSVMYMMVIAHMGEQGLKSVTSNLNISFLKRVKPGALIAEAILLKMGQRQSVGDIRIYNEGIEDPVAHVVTTYMLVHAAGELGN
ncbi:MAG: PaaI family thioesterase [SAR324 cluster bacterium]|nr:PaaI family thioesterase [SAR324 cluster bacterium]